MRELRRKNGWSLKDVSARSGISYSTLSKVENNKLSLTYDKLILLSRGLGVDMRVLFDAALTPDESTVPWVSARRSVARGLKGDDIETPAYRLSFLFEELSNKRMEPVVMRLKAQSLKDYGGLVRHPGEEMILVLEGAVDVCTDGYEPLNLRKHDSAYLDSTMGHAYLQAGPEGALLLAVCAGGLPQDVTKARAQSKERGILGRS
ncbi:MAG TPA: XRE family transcriptional regulator [Steroidobacteraceae bacterium]|nr:XRE family transcriptional regulator [Steroidobacteraceae bacterium]